MGVEIMPQIDSSNVEWEKPKEIDPANVIWDDEKEKGTITKAPPWWMREVVKPTMEWGTATVAGAIPALPAIASMGITAPAAVAAGVPMFGAGYALGKRVYEVLEKGLYGSEEPNLPEPTMGQTIRDVRTGMLYDIAGQAIGAAAGALVGKMATPGAREIGKQLEKKGIEYGLADLYPNSRLTAWMERLMEYYPGSTDVAFKHQLTKLQRMNGIMNEMRGRYTTGENFAEVGRSIKGEAEKLLRDHTVRKTAQMDIKRQQMVDAFNKNLNNFVNDLRGSLKISTKHEAGAQFSTILQGTKGKMEQLESKAWSKLDEMVGKDIVVDIPLQDVAQKMVDEQMAIKLGERDKGLIKRLQGYLPKEKVAVESKTAGGFKISEKMLERDPTLRIEGGAEEMTWYGMDKTKSSLLRRNREIHAATQRWDTPEQRVNEKLIEGINESMKQHAEKIGGNVWDIYRGAATQTKRIHDLFDKDILKIMQSNPEAITRKILKTGDQGVTLLRQIKAISGDEGLIPIREATFGELINVASKDNKFSGKALRGAMNRIGDETLSELLTKNQKQFLNDLANKEIAFSEQFLKTNKKEVVSFLDKVARKDDRGVVNLILQPGNDRYVYIAEKVFSPERLKELKAMSLEEVFKRNAFGDILPLSSAKALKVGTGKGIEIPMRRLFRNDGTFDELQEFLNMAMNMKRVEELAANTSRTAGTWHFMHTIGKAMAHPVATATAFASQYTIARMYFSPAARKLMIQAWKLPPTSRIAIESFSKAAMIIAEEDKKEFEKKRLQE